MGINIKDILVSAMMPVIKAVGKAEIEAVLAGVKEHNTPELYENTLKALNSSFKLLNEVAMKTSTKIDDGIVSLVLEAVQEAAAADNITL